MTGTSYELKNWLIIISSIFKVTQFSLGMD